MILEISFLKLLDPISLEIILISVVGVFDLEFLHLCFSFWKLFLNFFWAFSEVSKFPKELFAGLGFWVFGLRFSILESFMIVS